MNTFLFLLLILVLVLFFTGIIASKMKEKQRKRDLEKMIKKYKKEPRSDTSSMWGKIAMEQFLDKHLK